MATTRPFAFNTGSTIGGTTQVGNLAIGVNGLYDYSTNPGGVTWWMGPDEDNCEIIGLPTVTGNTVEFWRTSGIGINEDYVRIVNQAGNARSQSGFTNTVDSLVWIETSGYTTFTGATFESESQALFDRITGSTLSNSLKELINKTIRDLKSSGVWDLGDCLYLRGVHSAELACLNWIKNAHNSTAVNSPLFIPGEGFKGDGSSSFLNNNYIPATDNVNFSQPDASILFQSPRLGTANSKGLLGSYHTSPLAYTWIRFNTTSGYEDLWLNNYGQNQQLNIKPGDIAGASRTGVTSIQAYSNGIAVGPPYTTTSWANSSPYNVLELGMNGAGVNYAQYNGSLSFSWYGGYLDSSKVLSLSNSIKYFYDNLTLLDGYDNGASMIFVQMTTEPSVALKNLINKTVIDLKSAGIWNKLDILYFFNVHDSQAGLLNWIDPMNNITIVGTGVTFTQKVGFKGDGTSSYLQLNYDPGVRSTKAWQYMLNDSMHGFMAPTLSTTNSVFYGVRRSDSYINVQYYTSLGSLEYVHINDTGIGGFYAGNFSGSTVYQFNRTSSTGGDWYINGGSKSSFSITSSGYVPYNGAGWNALGWNNYGTPAYSDVQMANLFAGASLTESENASFYNIINYFNSNVGGTF